MDSVILARHGESVFSARHLVNGDAAVAGPLTERGEEEARELGRAIAADRIELCVTSEFERTQQTANVALEGRDVPRLVVAELNDPRYELTAVPVHLEELGYFYDVLSVQTAQEALLGKKTAEDVANQWAKYLTDAQQKWLAKQKQ